MISSLSVGARFEIVDAATPTIQRIAREVSELADLVDRAQAALRSLGTERFAGLSRSLAAIERRMAGVTGAAERMGAAMASAAAGLDAGLVAASSRIGVAAAELRGLAAAGGRGGFLAGAIGGGAAGGGGRGGHAGPTGIFGGRGGMHDVFMGGAILGVGGMIAEHLVKPAREYGRQVFALNAAGLSHVEVIQAIADAWKTTHTVMTTTATQNLRSLLDLRNILVSQEREQYGRNLPPAGSPARRALEQADWQAARNALPLVATMQQAMTFAAPDLYGKGGAQSDFAFAAAKALDIRGAATNPRRFQQELELMGQVGIWSQGRVTPQQYQSVLRYARQSAISLSPEFVYGPLASLMLETATSGGGQGGGSRGIGPALAAGYRWGVQGIMTKPSVAMADRLHLLPPGHPLRTTTTGTITGPVLGADLLARDPFQWTQKVLRPAVDQYLQQHRTPVTRQNEMMIANQLFRGNQLAAFMFDQFLAKAENIERDVELRRQALTPTETYRLAQRQSPDFAFAAFGAQWTNLTNTLGTSILPNVTDTLSNVTIGVQALNDVLRASPAASRNLSLALTGLAGSLAFSGSVLVLRGAFAGIAPILGAVGRGAETAATGLGRLLLGVDGLGAGLATAFGRLAPWLAFIQTMSPSTANKGENAAMAARPDLYPFFANVQAVQKTLDRNRVYDKRYWPFVPTGELRDPFGGEAAGWSPATTRFGMSAQKHAALAAGNVMQQQNTINMPISVQGATIDQIIAKVTALIRAALGNNTGEGSGHHESAFATGGAVAVPW